MVADGVNGVKITGKYICQSVKKLSLFIFCHAPKQNISPGSYDYPPPPRLSQVEENYSFLLNSLFLESIFSQQKVNYEAQRMTKIKRARILSQVLINSTIFATFIFLVSVFCHNLDSIMLK